MPALESLLWKLEQLIGLPFEIGLGRTVPAYADDITVMVSDASEVETVGSIVKEYK